VAVVGPNARKVLEKLGGMDVSKEALGFMEWADGTIGGFDARAYRISFSGELSYEIAVPASQGLAFWEALIEAGEEFGAMPLRAEKGFIMIGDETDGTVIPQDLNLQWALSKKKDDYLGKRAHARSHMADPNRWKLVGLETLFGRVTSTYYSANLERGIAMGLVRNGPDRVGEVIDFPKVDGTIVQAKIVDPVIYDKDGEKQNV